MLIVICSGIGYTWSVFQGPLIEHFHWDLSAASLIFTVQIAMSTLTPILFGRYQTRLGTRNYLLCGALVLASILTIKYRQEFVIKIDKSVVIASCLLAIALIYTYLITPQMSALGMSLNEFNGTELLAGSMSRMHVVYWLLEGSKLVLGTVLLGKLYRNSCSLV